MIVKIFCAVLVVLGVSVAIVLGGLIIYVHKLYAGILPITFSTMPSFLNSILIKWRVLCP